MYPVFIKGGFGFMRPKKCKIRDEDIDSSQLSGMDIYISDIHDTKLLSAEEEHDLARRISEGDEEARNLLVEANLRLVVNIARSFIGRGWTIDDLIEEGNIGLIRAADNYKLSEGTRFSTYASYWIQQAIKRAIINHSKLIRLPAYMVEIISKWRRATVLLEEELHRPPYSEEIARRIGLPKKQMALTLKALCAYRVANVPEGNDGQGLDHTIMDLAPPPDEILMERNLVEKVHEVLGELTEREANVLKLRFGIEEECAFTLTQVGARMKLTRERVRQISMEVLDKIGSAFNK